MAKHRRMSKLKKPPAAKSVRRLRKSRGLPLLGGYSGLNLDIDKVLAEYERARASDDGMPEQETGSVGPRPKWQVHDDTNDTMGKFELPPFMPKFGTDDIEGINHDSTRAAEIAKRASVVEAMVDKRRAMKGQVNQPNPYPWQTTDNAKMRECHMEGTRLLCEAIIKAAKIIAGRVDDETAKLLYPDENGWRAVDDYTPYAIWIETTCYRNKPVVTKAMRTLIGDGDKWLTNETGAVRIYTPTHWRWIKEA